MQCVEHELDEQHLCYSYACKEPIHDQKLVRRISRKLPVIHQLQTRVHLSMENVVLLLMVEKAVSFFHPPLVRKDILPSDPSTSLIVEMFSVQ